MRSKQAASISAVDRSLVAATGRLYLPGDLCSRTSLNANASVISLQLNEFVECSSSPFIIVKVGVPLVVTN